MPNIFISYRREETAYVAATIAEKLVNKLGKSSVFLDIDNIPMGVDFRKHLGNAIARADLVLVLIGQSWLTCVNEDGTRRLDCAADFVRIEIEAALKRGITIVPILLENARMPRPEDLPESMRAFAFRNATELRPGKDFLTQLQRLVEACEKFGRKKAAAKTRPVKATIVPTETQPLPLPLPQPQPLPLALLEPPPRRTFGRMIAKLFRFALWMDRPHAFIARMFRAVFLGGAVFACFASILFAYVLFAAPRTSADSELDATTESIYSILFVGMPWLPLYLFIWLPGRLVQLLALVDRPGSNR